MMNRNRFLFLVSFVSGFSIMAMEMTAARMMAPFFGTSQIIWTNIIGIVLIALSLGYYYGGKYADKHPDLNRLLIPMLISGMIFLATPVLILPVAQIVLDLSSTFTAGTILLLSASFLATIALFAFPIFLLGMVSPFVIRLLETDKEHLGSVAGIVFAFGTLGSILGTFLPILFFIPQFGVKRTVAGISLLLILLSLSALRKKHLLAITIPFFLFSVLPPLSSAQHIYASDSIYQHIRVHQDAEGNRRLAFNEGLGMQSFYSPETILSGEYYDAYLPLVETGDRVLILGLAGGTIARGLTELHGENVHITGVEIDAKVVEVAKTYFDLPESVVVEVADARSFVQQTEQSYDVIIVDAYSNEMYIPWTMSTNEFFNELKSILTDDGIIALNINAVSENSPLLLIMENTIASVFAFTERIPLTHNQSINYLLLASNAEIQPLLVEEQPVLLQPISTIVNHQRLPVTNSPNTKIFTDDWAPVELFTDKMILDFFKKENRH